MNKSGESAQVKLTGIDDKCKVKEVYVSPGVGFARGVMTLPSESVTVYSIR